MAPLETYCKEILHSGCALIAEKHSWENCPEQRIYFRIASKHQKRLKGLGLAIGTWVDVEHFQIVEKHGNR